MENKLTAMEQKYIKEAEGRKAAEDKLAFVRNALVLQCKQHKDWPESTYIMDKLDGLFKQSKGTFMQKLKAESQPM